MATFVVLASFTDQGIRNVKDTTKRAAAAKESMNLVSFIKRISYRHTR